MPLHLLDLPIEIRYQIYECLFSSTRILYGCRHTAGCRYDSFKPSPNALAIIRTSQGIHHETKTLWLKHVLIAFEDPITMLDTLWSLPPSLLSQIRHLRVYSYKAPLAASTADGDDDDGAGSLSVSDTVALLPGMQLDTLTVLCDHWFNKIEDAYSSLVCIVEQCKGWRTLRYILLDPPRTQSSDVRLSSCGAQLPYGSASMKKLSEILRDRDGELSGAGVTVYRSMGPGTSWSVFEPTDRVISDPEPADLYDAIRVGETAEPTAETVEGPILEKLYEIQRGAGADITEHDSSRSMTKRYSGKTWPEIRRNRMPHLLWTWRPELPPGQVHAVRKTIVVDSYDSVEDHVWTIHQ